MKSTRGEVTLILAAVLAAVGLFAMFRPKWSHGESRRADTSKQATEQVEQAVAVAVAAEQAKSATAAASVAQIGIAAADAPASPAIDFIRRETPFTLSLLPHPDPAALLAAERRRLAIMEGKLAQAEKLYADAYKDAAALTARAERAEQQRSAAFAARRQADSALAEAAAANLALTRQRAQLLIALGALVLLVAIARLYLVSPATLGRIAADVRSGENPITALDRYLSPWLHAHVRRAAKLSTEPKDDPLSK